VAGLQASALASLRPDLHDHGVRPIVEAALVLVCVPVRDEEDGVGNDSPCRIIW
jgi:hypothetical protein